MSGVLDNRFALSREGRATAASALTKASDSANTAQLADATMLYAPRSGGVKRYLAAKRTWLSAHRPGVIHSLIVPGALDRRAGPGGVSTLQAPRLPFGDGYRWPSSVRRWSAAMAALKPDVIEAGDPYVPGQAALEAGRRAGCPVIGFCHSDPAALAALHFGEWTRKPVERRWARVFSRFDCVIAPSRYIASRLEEAGVGNVTARPLGVDIGVFHPDRADPGGLRRRLGLDARARLLVFAGRPAREKNVGMLIDAVQRLGNPYYLVLIGAGVGLPKEERVFSIPYEPEPAAVAAVVASCDAFVHANDHEPFGLVVLEAMACGRPVVGVDAGGVAETVDRSVGELANAATPAALASAIESLFARDIEAVGRAARQRVVERYAWDRVFEDLCGVYGELTGRASFTQCGQGTAIH